MRAPPGRSGADAGEFFVVLDVDDLELFGVHAGIGAEGQFAEVTFLHLDEMFLVLGAQAFEHGGMDDDAELEIRFVARCVS